MRWATIIEGMAPAEPIAMPIPSVPRSRSGTLGASARATPKPTIAKRQAANAVDAPNRAARRGPAGANTPMHRTGIVVRRPAMPAGSPRSARINGSNGPIARICGRIASEAMNSPATTATGTARALTVTGSGIRRSPGRRDHGSMLGAPTNCSRASVAARGSVAGCSRCAVSPASAGHQRSVAVGVVVSTRWVGALWTAGMLPSRPAW